MSGDNNTLTNHHAIDVLKEYPSFRVRLLGDSCPPDTKPTEMVWKVSSTAATDCCRLFTAFSGTLTAGLLQATQTKDPPLVSYAVNFAPMATVSALRESSVIIAALIGTLLLGEPSRRRQIAAAAMVAGGVALIMISGP